MEAFLSWIRGKAKGAWHVAELVRLTARIMAIMLFSASYFSSRFALVRSISYDADPIRICCP